MALGLIGKKVGYDPSVDPGIRRYGAVTVIDVKGNTFAQIKRKTRWLQCPFRLPLMLQKESRVAKPQAGHFKKLAFSPPSSSRNSAWKLPNCLPKAPKIPAWISFPPASGLT